MRGSISRRKYSYMYASAADVWEMLECDCIVARLYICGSLGAGLSVRETDVCCGKISDELCLAIIGDCFSFADVEWLNRVWLKFNAFYCSLSTCRGN